MAAKVNLWYVLCYPEDIQGTETDSAAIVFRRIYP
jgi:hypothetical protein